MRACRPIALLLAVSLAAGCGRRETTIPPAPGVVEGKGSFGGKPLAVLDQLTKALEEADKLRQEIEAKGPVDPVPFAELVELLPPPPRGWEGEEPRGETTEAGERKASTAERQYRNEERTLTARIVDHAYHSRAYVGFFIGAKFKEESADGYTKGLTIDGNPGLEKYQKRDRSGELDVLVGKRFLVHVEARGVPAEFVREVYRTVDAKKLAALAE